MPSIQNTAKLVQEITASSIEQNNGANQVNIAIQQLNQISQQNAASSEELATSAEEMTSQAEQLQDIVSYFKVDTQVKKQQPKQVKKTSPKIGYKNLKHTPNKGIDLMMNDLKDDEFQQF